MSTVVTYGNDHKQCFCQIRLDSGERILIGMYNNPTPTFKICKVRFGGLIPTDTIWEFTAEMAGGKPELYLKVMMMFDANGAHPLDAVRDVLLRCGSIIEVRQEIHRRYAT